MGLVNKIIDQVIDIEAGYVDHPSDRGGPTKYGITQAVARADGYTGDMRDLPRERAVSILYRQYVVAPGFDKAVALNERIGAELVDTGVNMGPGTAGKFLQRWLNGFMGSALVVDGKVGPGTIGVLQSFLAKRGEPGVQALLRSLNAAQAMRYLEIVEKDESQRPFIFGWVNQRVAI